MSPRRAPAPRVYLDVHDARLAVPSHLFTPLSPDERREASAEYLHFLRATDGVPDPVRHRLPVREQRLRALAPMRGDLALQRRFVELLSGRSPLDRDVPVHLIWAVCALKFSCTEGYAVDYLQKNGRYVHDDVNSPYTYIDIHELYHERFLNAALSACGLEPVACLPRWPTRWLLRTILRLPRSVANVGVFCGEIAGVIAFKLLLDRVSTLSTIGAAARLQITDLLRQLILDELGHVLFLQTQLGPARVYLAKKVLPIVAKVVIRDVPEVAHLIDPHQLYLKIIAADMREIAALLSR